MIIVYNNINILIRLTVQLELAGRTHWLLTALNCKLPTHVRFCGWPFMHIKYLQQKYIHNYEIINSSPIILIFTSNTTPGQERRQYYRDYHKWNNGLQHNPHFVDNRKHLSSGCIVNHQRILVAPVYQQSRAHICCKSFPSPLKTIYSGCMTSRTSWIPHTIASCH